MFIPWTKKFDTSEIQFIQCYRCFYPNHVKLIFRKLKVGVGETERRIRQQSLDRALANSKRNYSQASSGGGFVSTENKVRLKFNWALEAPFWNHLYAVELHLNQKGINTRSYPLFYIRFEVNSALGSYSLYQTLFYSRPLKNHGHKCFITERKQREMGHNTEPPYCQQTTRC